MGMDPREQHGRIGIGIATAGQGPAVVVIRDFAEFLIIFFFSALLRKCGILVRITEWSGPLWPVGMGLIWT